MFEKALNYFIPQGFKEEKNDVPKFVEKKLKGNKLFASCIKEGEKVHQDTIIMKYELKLCQPVMLGSSKIKFPPRRLKTKWLSLWVVKEIKTNGTVEIESPYSRKLKL